MTTAVKPRGIAIAFMNLMLEQDIEKLYAYSADKDENTFIAPYKEGVLVLIPDFITDALTEYVRQLRKAEYASTLEGDFTLEVDEDGVVDQLIFTGETAKDTTLYWKAY